MKPLIIFVLVILGVTVSSQSDTLIQEMAQRLLSLGAQVDLVIGKLPPVDLEIPIPDESRLLGYARYGYKGENQNAQPLFYTVLFDAKQNYNELMSFYKTKLEGVFQIQERYYKDDRIFLTKVNEPPFYDTTVPTEIRFCRANGNIKQITFYVTKLNNSIRDFRVSLHPQNCPSSQGITSPFEKDVNWPHLNPPENAHFTTSYRFGGAAGPNQSMEFETQQNVQEIHKHYVTEMQRNGWTLDGENVLGPLIQSIWGFTDTLGKHLIMLSCQSVPTNKISCTVYVLQ